MTDKTMIPIKITTSIDPRLIADMVCSAFEAGHCGCLYWMPKSRPPRGFKANIEEHCNWYSDPATWTPGRGVIIKFWEDTNDDGIGDVIHRLNVDDIGARLEAVAHADPRLFALLLNSEDEPLDGPKADELLQLLILGEVRYG